MAGNIKADNNGDILVEFDYNNIFVVDPNKTIDNFGKIQERLVDHENLVMYVNLEAEILPRTKLSVGGAPDDRLRVISVAKIDFLKPTKENYLGVGYYDEFTGENTTNYKGQNQFVEKKVQPTNGGKSYSILQPVDLNNIVDNGLLGITSIDITTSTSFIPSVKMELEDVQGKALFQLGENSPYAAFFNLPPCQFYLTLKGFYGQAIKYQLNLKTFNARFNSFSGNYQVTLEFVGYKFNILNEISMGHLLALPHMYSKRFDITTDPVESQQTQKNAISQGPNNVNQNNNSVTSNSEGVTQIIAKKGYQKIREVYSEYKSKGLIPSDFPEITLVQLMNKLETFEQNIVNSLPKAEVESLTNIRTYKEYLKQYFDSVRGSNTSWFSKYLDSRPIILLNGDKVYAFKSNIDLETKSKNAIPQLQNLINEYTKKLLGNATLGEKGPSPIKVSITYDTIKYDKLVQNNVDWIKTTIEQTGNLNPTQAQINSINLQYFSNNLTAEITPQNEIVPIYPTFFIFDGNSRFDKQISTIEAEANRKLSEYESLISNKLLEKIEDTNIGIGFKPTVRSIIAVIMASAEGFIRLMDEVHTNAWSVKYDPVRRLAILDNPSSAPSSDVVENPKYSSIATQTNPNVANSQQPVYPWPQFFKETPEDKKGRFQLKYIADPSVVDITQGYLYEKWPEVEFVEEYLTGITQKFDPPAEPPPLDNELYTNTININAIEFPNNGLAYLNKEEIKFFYEIWERQFLTARYSNLIRANQNQINELINLNIEAEVNNIVNGLGVSSPFLTFKLKNDSNLNSNDYINFLMSISNSGTGKAYQNFIRDFFVTPYIRNLTENSFGILNVLELGKIPQTSTQSDALLSLLKNATNESLIIDTIPFTNDNWTKTNLSNGQSNVQSAVYDTKKTLKVFEPRKIIANFSDVYNFIENRPVTNFSYKENNNPIITVNDLIKNQRTLNFFYSTREPSKFVPTEGYSFYNSPSNQLSFRSTTSMLNTPYFINSILNGVDNNRGKDPYPYIQSAYLFLNSLPLATLREKYKTLNGTTTEELDYIASCFKKFGAIHKLPYSWILKLGSNWHRYKKFKQTGVDILTTCWSNFDYVSNYSPISGSTTQTYTFNYPNVGIQSITLQQESEDSIDVNVGFYPKLITDFNYFYTGYDLYEKYTNEEIQKSVDLGVKFCNFTNSNINGVVQGVKSLNLKTWSVLVPQLTTQPDKVCNTKDNTRGNEYFVVPSFGSQINQTKEECIFLSQTVVPITSNPSVYNGSVRGLWSAPNYGYFDTSQISYPNPDSYITLIENTDVQQSPFSLLNNDNYSKIEEIFSVFEKRILDSFENEFLKFSKPLINADTGNQPSEFLQSNVNINANFRNFQSLMKSLMTVSSISGNIKDEEYFQNVINQQYGIFTSTIQSFLEFDVLFKYGNPSNYKRRIWDSYLSYLTIPVVTDPIPFEPYVINSLPSKSGGITLNQSKINNPQAWITLETEVGFSTIPNVVYTNSGSYITDFFIENNIKFSSENIELLAPIIKMWATQKVNTPSLTVGQFKNQIKEYLKKETDLQNYFLDQVLSKVKLTLPDQQQLPERQIKSAVQGQISKVELYEVFKALNDKWIAGADFSNKTLFEDILFLDKASRNIGETIVIDIFDLKNMFSKSSINEVMSVFTFISGILIKNNFTVMNLPSYVNFYNIQDVDGTTIPQPEGSLEFANSMWGTFLNVDYRKSSPKMICFFVGRPSEYLELPKGNFRFRNDAFDMGRASENPLIENQKDKKDWAVSNKCVGFNVDIGTRNQNIFFSFSVSQDSGVATSESINTLVNMVDQYSGRNVATQNVSLYNFYKQRSYKCEIVSLGNALIQPTMYFNLRHVPMFNGPYMITNVTHSIQPGTFQTKFQGVRQGIFDLPAIDTFLQSINQNLLTKLQELLKIQKENTSISATTENNKSAEVVQKSNNKIDASNSCVNNVDTLAYRDFVVTAATQTELTPQQMSAIINEVVPNQNELAVYIYCICYAKTFVQNGNSKIGNFVGYNNNFANISLSTIFTPTSNTYFSKNYCCINVQSTTSVTKSEPVVGFQDAKTFVSFIAARLKENVSRINSLGITKYYVCYWPKQNVSETYYDNNQNEFQVINQTMIDSIVSATNSGLLNQTQSQFYTDKLKNENKTNPPNVTPTPSPIPPNPGQTCPPPIISSFAPTQGNTGTIIQINGFGFENVTGVTINGVMVNFGKDVTVFNSTTMRVSVPQVSTGNQIVTGSIILMSQFGNSVQSIQQQFIYNPSLDPSNAASPGSYQNNANASISNSNTNTNPQETGPVTMISSYNPDQNKPDSLNVKINPELNGWLIEFRVDMNFVIKELENNNGRIIPKLIKQGSKPISNLVTNNQFNITKDYIINNNLLSYTPIVGKSQIDLVFVLKAISSQQVTVQQQFPFNIYYTTENQSEVPVENVPVTQTKPTYPEKAFSIVSLGYQDTLFGNGPTYYNIVKPGGGFIGMQITPPIGEEVNQDWIVSVKVINLNYSVLKITIENSQNTKLTNVINVSGLGQFRLQIEYQPYGTEIPTNGEVLTQTLLGPVFTL